MSQWREHLEPVAATSGRKHTCNFNFSSAPPFTAGVGPRAGCRTGSRKPHVGRTRRCSIISNVFEGILNYFCKELPVRYALWSSKQDCEFDAGHFNCSIQQIRNLCLNGPLLSDKARSRRQVLSLKLTENLSFTTDNCVQVFPLIYKSIGHLLNAHKHDSSPHT